MGEDKLPQVWQIMDFFRRIVYKAMFKFPIKICWEDNLPQVWQIMDFFRRAVCKAMFKFPIKIRWEDNLPQVWQIMDFFQTGSLQSNVQVPNQNPPGGQPAS